ncbi:hypothetical protein ACX12E_19015 [Paenibacillus vandeheii]
MSRIEQLYAQFRNALQPGGGLELIGALKPHGRILSDRLSSLVHTEAFFLQNVNIVFDEKGDTFTIAANEAQLGFGETTVTLLFSLHADALRIDITAASTSASGIWRWKASPWIALKLDGLHAVLEEDATPGVKGEAKLSAQLGAQWVHFVVQYPFHDIQELQADLQPPTPFQASSLQPFTGGADFLSLLPPDLRHGEVLLSKLTVLLQTEAQKVSEIVMTVSVSEWRLFKDLVIKPLGITITVIDPAVNPQVAVSFEGNLEITHTQGTSVIVVKGNGEGLSIHLKEDSNALPIQDFFSLFLPGITVPDGIGSISMFHADILFEPDLSYTIEASIVPGATAVLDGSVLQLELTELAAKGSSKWQSVEITGKALMGKAEAEISARYLNRTNPDTAAAPTAMEEWIFTGIVRGKDDLSMIPDPIRSAVDEVRFQYSTKTKEWSLTAITTKWNVGFLDGLYGEMNYTQPEVGPSTFDMCAVYPVGGEEFRVCYVGPEAYRLEWYGISGSYDKSTQSFSFNLGQGNFNIGNIVESAVSWATSVRYGLSAPWDQLNGIALNDKATLQLTFEGGKLKEIGFNYELDMELVIAHVKGIALTYYPKQHGAEARSEVTVKGDFYWNDKNKLCWDPTDPSKAPTGPGTGKELFDLSLIALGQHVALPGGTEVEHVKQALSLVEELPNSPSSHIFDKNAGWLFAMDLSVLKTNGQYLFSLGLIFNDPKLYGLHLSMLGELFHGLDFEIMYEKVDDSTGVYKANIQLPDVIRYLEFGAYSLTLPNFSLAFYTNGDFKVDIGFPWSFDFSRSFTIQTIVPPGLPAIGSAGFYINKLSGNTSDRVPVSSAGHFGTVLEFGFGMRLGLGKEIVKGPLKAGFSVTIFGILEGVLAKWIPWKDESGHSLMAGSGFNLEGEYYYYIEGTVGIQGKLFGIADLSLVKANVDLLVEFASQVAYEAYGDVVFALIAHVRISIKVKIGSGHFAIKFNVHYEDSISESFKLEVSGTSPWGANERQVGRLFARNEQAVREPVRLCKPDEREIRINLDQLLPNPSTYNIFLNPVIALGSDTTGSETRPALVLLLSIETVEERTPEQLNNPEQDVFSDFEVLCAKLFRWLVAATLEKESDESAVDGAEVSCAMLTALKNFLSSRDEDGNIKTWTPLPPEKISQFLERQFHVNIQLCPDPGESGASLDKRAFFPMAPQLELVVSGRGESFDHILQYRFDQVACISDSYLFNLQTRFDKLAVQLQQDMQRGTSYARQATKMAPCDFSIAEFVFMDYFLLLCRQLIEAGFRVLEDYEYPLKEQLSIGEIVERFCSFKRVDATVYTAYDLLFANLDHKVEPTLELLMKQLTYRVQPMDTLNSILQRYDTKIADPTGWITTQVAPLKNVFRSGAKIKWKRPDGKDQEYTFQGTESLTFLQEQAGYPDIPAFLAGSEVMQTQALRVDCRIPLPEMTIKQSDGETLRLICEKFSIDLWELAEEQSVLNSAALFSVAEKSTLTIGKIECLEAGKMFESLRQAHALRNLSGMASHYFLHALRLPAKDIPFPSDMHTRRPELLGLFSLTGQQFNVPISDEEWTFTLDNPDNLQWVTL